MPRESFFITMATFTCGLCGEEIHVAPEHSQSFGRVLLAHRESCRSRTRDRDQSYGSPARANAHRDPERNDPDRNHR
jgi:hypothetical protein